MELLQFKAKAASTAGATTGVIGSGEGVSSSGADTDYSPFTGAGVVELGIIRTSCNTFCVRFETI